MELIKGKRFCKLTGDLADSGNNPTYYQIGAATLFIDNRSFYYLRHGNTHAGFRMFSIDQNGEPQLVWQSDMINLGLYGSPLLQPAGVFRHGNFLIGFWHYYGIPIVGRITLRDSVFVFNQCFCPSYDGANFYTCKAACFDGRTFYFIGNSGDIAGLSFNDLWASEGWEGPILDGNSNVIPYLVPQTYSWSTGKLFNEAYTFDYIGSGLALAVGNENYVGTNIWLLDLYQKQKIKMFLLDDTEDARGFAAPFSSERCIWARGVGDAGVTGYYYARLKV